MYNINDIDYSQFKTKEQLLESKIYSTLATPVNETKKNEKENSKELSHKSNNSKDDSKEKKHHPDQEITNPKRTIFKNILIFTRDRSENNKTLNNIKEAIKEYENPPRLHVFVAANMDGEEDGSKIHIQDDVEEYVIDKNSNLDTLVFSRLGVQDENECEHIVQLLQDRGFLVLNPVRYSALACDKYQSALLFERGEIPQPNFCLMDKATLYNEDSLYEQMTRVYKDYSKEDKEANKKLEVVIKTLDGHGGTGVFLTDCKNMFPILQTIFSIDPERKLLVQKKEEADGGDIRVHVLTLRNKQVVLGSMKRIKISSDFRSNVSLGATAEPVKLTDEQIDIALRAAKISKLPWCAVDIMPLTDGSNVVLEINASPGTTGISEVLGKNFINILLDNLQNPSEFMLQEKNAGYIESVVVKFTDAFSKTFLAKLDTGNSTAAPTIEIGEYKIIDNHIHVTIDGNEMSFEIERTMKAYAGDEIYERPVIKIPELTLGLRKIKNALLAVVKDRESKTTNMLLNRDVIGQLGYVVHPSNAHILTPEIQKITIKA